MAGNIDALITPEQLQADVKKHGLKLKTIAIETGVGASNISAWVTGLRPMTKAVKAMFFYYFKNKENGND